MLDETDRCILRHLQAEGYRFCMDAMRPAHAWRHLVLEGAFLDGSEQGVDRLGVDRVLEEVADGLTAKAGDLSGIKL